MNIEPITMEPAVAREHYRDYLRSVRIHRRERLARSTVKEQRKVERAEREDEELRRAYLALSRGQRVLNLPRVMAAAGLTADTHLPRLAICRANAERCEIRTQRDATVFRVRGTALGGTKADKVNVVGAFGFELSDWQWRRANKLPGVDDVQALVPFIPPRLRPQDPENYYILWEANWQLKPPDPDPFLLKRLGEITFVIVAQWDMTPREQAILAGRVG
jgi:hypothetical protein